MLPLQAHVFQIYNHTIKINFNDKMQNITNLNTTAQKDNTAINLLIILQEIKTSDAKQFPCPIKDFTVIISLAEINYHTK